MTTHGLHHVTAVTAQAKANLAFYTETLGLRLVKKTVNQDDVSAYHLFYADALGSPGTDMTFFDWKQAGPKAEGTDQISRTFFRASGVPALEYWLRRFDENKVRHGGIVAVGGKEAVLFEDFEGQRLGIINDGGAPFEGKAWDRAVPAGFALRGFYAVEISVPYLGLIEDALAGVLGWEKAGTYRDGENENRITVFAMEGGGPGKEVHVRELVDAQRPLASTAGSVHHVAFRLKDESEMRAWIGHLNERRMPNSGIVDRFYFKSLYFRVSPGILFELATDGPGFSSDEDVESLGERLSLPPFLEPHRKAIEEGLQAL